MCYVIKDSIMNKTVLIDAGHGGVLNGIYQTAGKRSPVWDDGRILIVTGKHNTLN